MPAKHMEKDLEYSLTSMLKLKKSDFKFNESDDYSFLFPIANDDQVPVDLALCVRTIKDLMKLNREVKSDWNINLHLV